VSKTILMTFFQAAESPPEAEDVCGDTNGQRPKTISSAESFSSVEETLRGRKTKDFLAVFSCWSFVFLLGRVSNEQKNKILSEDLGMPFSYLSSPA